MTGLEELAAIARSVAIRAGRLVLDADRARPSRADLVDQSTRKSSATDLATATDREAERFIVEQLRALRPEDAILGEEGARDEGTTGLTWLVDPIDGTTNFVYAFPAWTVSVAVSDDQGPLAGAVFEPVRDECFVAMRGGGSTLNGKSLGPLIPSPLSEALVATGFSYSSELRAQQARLLPVVLQRVRDMRRAGAASLDCCYVGAGRVDAYYEAALKPWDTAAGGLVAREAGAESRVVEGLLAGEETLVLAPEPLLSEFVELLFEATRALSVR